MRDKRIETSGETIAEALIGDYRREHLFTLRQSLQAYSQYKNLIAACDQEIEQYLKESDAKLDPHPEAAGPNRRIVINLGATR